MTPVASTSAMSQTRLGLPPAYASIRASGLHRRAIVICPFANGPEHEFVPLYVQVMVIVVRFRWAVPVARAEQSDDIMLFIGMSIAKVMSSPDMVPVNEPGMRPCMPETLIVPVTADPAWESCHVTVPIPACPIMAPTPNPLLESDALPVHVPVAEVCDVDATGVIDGAIGESPPQPTATRATTAAANILISLYSSPCATPSRLSRAACLF